MTVRLPPARPPTLVAAAVLAGLGVLALIYSLTLPDPHPVPPHPAALPVATAAAGPASSAASRAATVAVATGAASATAAGEGPVVDGGASTAALQRALDASSPPDLPGTTASKLAALARGELTHELVTAGTAAGLQIQAVIARSHDGRADLADVTLLYRDQDPANLEPEHLAVLAFAHTPAGWVPVVGQNGVSVP